MNPIFLESPFGTIRYRFHTETQCGVSLVEPGPIVVNRVKVEGVLQFKLEGQTWTYVKKDSYIDRADIHRCANETIQNKLATTATGLLNEWHQANPDDFKAIQAALLEVKLKEEKAELSRLVDRTTQQQRLVEALQQQLAMLR